MYQGLEESQLPAALEALLFVTDEPVSAVTLAQMLEVETAQAKAALRALQQQLGESNRGIQLLEVAGGWRLYTHPAYHELLEKYVLSWDTRKLSAAALEVLAIVAYIQPATRGQISTIRGVNSEGPLNTLIERGYVKEAGVADAPGNPTLYATTRTFLEKYGLASTRDLPDLAEFAPDEKTAQLIRERLGAPAFAVLQDEDGTPLGAEELGERGEGGDAAAASAAAAAAAADQIVADATARILGVVDKIDFDQLTFNTDDE